MIQVSIARRYARALLQVAQETGETDAILSDLETLVSEASSSEDLQAVLESPLFSREQRRKVLDALCEQMKLEETTRNFLRLLVDRDRTPWLEHIVRIYRDLADALAGRVRAEVRTAYPLTDGERDQMKDALAKATGKTIVLESREDKRLIGGVIAQVGDTTFDGSLETQLKHLRENALS